MSKIINNYNIFNFIKSLYSFNVEDIKYNILNVDIHKKYPERYFGKSYDLVYQDISYHYGILDYYIPNILENDIYIDCYDDNIIKFNEIIKIFLESGISPNYMLDTYTKGYHKLSLLQIACKSNNSELVKILIKAGANLTINNNLYNYNNNYSTKSYVIKDNEHCIIESESIIEYAYLYSDNYDIIKYLCNLENIICKITSSMVVNYTCKKDELLKLIITKCGNNSKNYYKSFVPDILKICSSNLLSHILVVLGNTLNAIDENGMNLYNYLNRDIICERYINKFNILLSYNFNLNNTYNDLLLDYLKGNYINLNIVKFLMTNNIPINKDMIIYHINLNTFKNKINNEDLLNEIKNLVNNY